MPAPSGVRPAVLTGAQSPRPPVVQNSRAPSPPQTPRPTTPSKASEPPESGWDDAADGGSGVALRDVEEARLVPAVRGPAPVGPRPASSADLAPIARRARSSPDLPPVVQAAAPVQASPPVRPPEEAPQAHADSAPRALVEEASSPGLSEDVQEQLFGVLRGALEASLLPLLEKQQQLEARLEWLHQAEQRAAAAAARRPSPNVPKILSIPPGGGLSSPPPKVSLVPTSYGFVIAPEGPPRRPSIEAALEHVGPIDMPDFGRGRRAAGTVLVGLLLAGVVAAIAATILSYT